MPSTEMPSPSPSSAARPAAGRTTPQPAAEEALPFEQLTRVTATLVRTGTVGVVIAGVAAAASAWLQAKSGAAAADEVSLRSVFLGAGIAAAILAMVSASVQAGAISKRDAILRERARVEAERARQERRRAREAAEREAARQAAEADEATRQYAEARALLEARAAAEQAAAEADPVTHALREREREEMLARLRAEQERQEREEKVERAIITGTRAA